MNEGSCTTRKGQMPVEEIEKVIDAIPTDQELIQRRRAQIAHAALTVFSKKGFHKSRVRDVAREAGLAVGTIYEYVSTKEDILYLACQQGFAEFEEKVREAVSRHTGPLEKLKAAIHAYYQIMGDIDDSILLLYRESQSLDQAGRRMIMRREEDVRRIFEEALAQGMEEGIFRVENPKLIAHDILVLGQMWGLKRWSLRKDLGLGEFTKLQMGLVLSGILAR